MSSSVGVRVSVCASVCIWLEDYHYTLSILLANVLNTSGFHVFTLDLSCPPI